MVVLLREDNYVVPSGQNLLPQKILLTELGELKEWEKKNLYICVNKK